jgi:hypothetical protein
MNDVIARYNIVSRYINNQTDKEWDVLVSEVARQSAILDALKRALHHIRNIPSDYDQVGIPKAFAIAAIKEGLESVGITNLADIE